MALAQSAPVQAVNSALRRVPAWLIYVLAFAWAAWLFFQAATGRLGAEPVNTLERAYGELALQLIIAGLCVTPLRRFVGINLIRYRRALGLAAFFFVAAHFAVWMILDLGLRWDRIWTEIVKRPYITVGFASFLMLVPLAVTSNNAALRKLGAASWQRLHKLTYPAAFLGGLHFLWLVKSWPPEPLLYMGAILALLAFRLVPKRRGPAAA